MRKIIIEEIETEAGIEWGAEYEHIKGLCGGGYTPQEALDELLSNYVIYQAWFEGSLVSFITAHPTNWKEEIQKEPYNIRVQENGNYTLLKYNQLNADFSIPLVRECRGIILKHNTVVARPFDKFFNYGEPLADDIDWASAVCQEKVDGSIMKLWNSEGSPHSWILSTNGMIDAHTELPEMFKGTGFISFGDIFEDIVGMHPKDFANKANLDMDKTYMFEMVSKANKVVLEYDEPAIYLIGIRDVNGKEYPTYPSPFWKLPKTYKIQDLSDAVKFVEENLQDQEGLVVVDKYYNRIKIKSSQYLRLHYLASNYENSTSRLLAVIRDGEKSEVLSYFPELKESLEKVECVYDKIIEYANNKAAKIMEKEFKNQKELAGYVFSTEPIEMVAHGVMRMVKQNKSASEWFKTLWEKKQLELFELFEKDLSCKEKN